MKCIIGSMDKNFKVITKEIVSLPGWTYQRVGDELGISKASAWRMENGLFEPSYSQAMILISLRKLLNSAVVTLPPVTAPFVSCFKSPVVPVVLAAFRVSVDSKPGRPLASALRALPSWSFQLSSLIPISASTVFPIAI